MTLQAHPVDLDALLAAASALAPHFFELGELDARVLGPDERSGRELVGGVALSVRTGGVSPGQVGLVAGTDAATAVAEAAVAAGGDALECWEPVMAAIVVALTDRGGDLDPQDVQVLASGAGNGPALDPEAISIGLFDSDQLLVAIGFVAEREAEAAPAAPVSQVPAAPVSQVPAAPVFQVLVGADTSAVDVRRMNLLRDVEMGVSVELGRTRMTVRDLLALAPGVIVELDKAAGAPVDLLVNGTLMARGEVVVIDEEFAVRISEIVTPEQDSRLGA
jgi:flagellar motor switch protein FliN/FliY